MSEEDLGPIVLDATLSAKNRLAVLALPVVALVFCGLIAVPVVLQAILGGDLAVGLVILFGVGVAGVAVTAWIVHLVRGLDLRHQVFERGWVWTSRGRKRTVRFADVTRFDDASFHLRLHGVVPNAILRLRDGGSVDVLRHGGFPGYVLLPGWAPTLVPTIGRQVARARVAETMRVHLAGQAIPFGDVVLEADGSLRVGETPVRAAGNLEVASVFRSRVLRIPRAGGVPLDVPLRRVPDHPLLVSVANYLASRRDEAPGAPVKATTPSIPYLPIPGEEAPSPFDPHGGTLVILVRYNGDAAAPVQHLALTRPFSLAEMEQVWGEIHAAWKGSQAAFELLERRTIRTGGHVRRLPAGDPVRAADLAVGIAYYTHDAPHPVEDEYLLLERSGKDTKVTVLPDGRLPRYASPEALDAAMHAEGPGVRLGTRVVASLFWHMHM